MDSLDTVTLRHLMRQVAQPVVVVTGRDTDHVLWGMTVSSFTTVSLDPPLALFCPSRASATWAAIGPVGHFVLNVLSADQHGVAARFARSGAGFPATVPHHVDDEGLPVLSEATFTAWCSAAAVHPGGDHDIVLARVGRVRAQRGGLPLSYWQGSYASVGRLRELS